MQDDLVGPPTVLDEARFADYQNPLTIFKQVISKTLVITGLELRKLRHDFTELVTRALQPALWLLIFGQVFARAHAIAGWCCVSLPLGAILYLALRALLRDAKTSGGAVRDARMPASSSTTS